MPRIRHTDDDSCPKCDQFLESAHERLGEWFRQIKKQFNDCHVSCAYRGRVEQEAEFEKGTTNAHFPDSKHNCERDGKPCAEALDLFQLSEGKAIFSMKYYEAIAEFSNSQGYSIKWPTKYRSKGKLRIDGPHFEIILV